MLIRAELLKLRTTPTFWVDCRGRTRVRPRQHRPGHAGYGPGGKPHPSPGQQRRGAERDVGRGVRHPTARGDRHPDHGRRVQPQHGDLDLSDQPRPQTGGGAKLAAASLVGVGVTLAASVLTLAIALPWLAAKHIDISLFRGDVALPLLGALAATALYPLVGVGVGALPRNQTVAVTIALVWVLIVEGVPVSFTRALGRWLPAVPAAP